MNLFELEIDRFERSFSEQDPFFLLKKALPIQVIEEMFQLHIPPAAIPKIHSGLPLELSETGRLVVKKSFCNLPLIKKHLFAKAFATLYKDYLYQLNITLFTWVMTDGLGDLIAHTEVSSLLKMHHLKHVILVPKKFNFVKQWPSLAGAKIAFYDGFEELEACLEDEEVKSALECAECILQVPTSYPFWESHSWRRQLKNKLHTLGQYGFIDSSWGHPARLNTDCLGLHTLEKGILIKSMPPQHSHTWRLVDGKIKKILTSVRDTNIVFVFAYLLSVRGAWVYLHLLLFSLKATRGSQIELAVPDARHLVHLILSKRIDWKQLGVKRVELALTEGQVTLEVGSEGKTLKVVHLGPIDSDSAKAMTSLSEGIVACRGDQSFSEVTSLGKPFFYDPPQHSQPFLHSLKLIVKQLTNYCLSDWIQLSMDCLQTNISLERLADRARDVLFDDRAFKELGSCIRNNYSANAYIQQVVTRKAIHSRKPDLAIKETQLLKRFYNDECGFEECYIRLSGLIQKNCR